MIVFGIVVAALVLVLAVTGFLLAGLVMRIRRQTLEESRAWQEDHYDLSWYDPMPKTDYTVRSHDGYLLGAQFLPNPVPSGRYVIISHGYTDNRCGSLKYVRLYLDLGFNVILYDLRGHGLNEPAFCTYSVRERKDLLAVILDTRERYPGISLLGLHGESLGAATSVAVLESKPPVDFVVADCGFSDISPVLKNALRGMRLPPLLVPLASLFAKFRYGYSFAGMRPVDCLKDNRVPILFIHGAEDSFILPEHSETMSRATAGYSEVRLIPGAAHALSVVTDPAAYRGYVEAFLRTVGAD